MENNFKDKKKKADHHSSTYNNGQISSFWENIFALLAATTAIALVLVHWDFPSVPFQQQGNLEQNSSAYLFQIVPEEDMDRSIALDRAVAWCSRTWDIESAALADTVLERLRMRSGDGNAATTVANLMVRATESHMRTASDVPHNNIGSNERDKYSQVLRVAAGLLFRAAQNEYHHGAHYSFALLLKLYPSLVAPGFDQQFVAQVAAAHLCASANATISKLNQVQVAGRALAASVNEYCHQVELFSDIDLIKKEATMLKRMNIFDPITKKKRSCIYRNTTTKK